MNRSQKSALAGAVLTVAVLVFVPSVYVWIGEKLGKLIPINKGE